MNRKVLAILALTLVALVILAVYSFGPLSSTRITTPVNPSSLQPTNSENVVIHNQDLILSMYHNKDVVENGYSVQLPQTWHVQSGREPGGYLVKFDGGDGAIGLVDVPDNSTLELFVLSQEEPQLKKSLPDYKRVDYRALAINGNEAYQLIYESTFSGEIYETVHTYIAGQDRASVVKLSAKQSDFPTLVSVFTRVLDGFRWDAK